MEPCWLRAAEFAPGIRAECTTLQVPLDPDAPSRATIGLFVARVPALTAEPAPDPVVVLAGGPGQAASQLFPIIQSGLVPAMSRRDVLLIDQRGTGRSTPLTCPAVDGMFHVPDDARIDALMKQCLEQLPQDPRWFTTSVAVRDLEAVRRHLGIERWNLYGVSYGTRVALHYLRRHSDRVRTAVLDGVVLEDRILGPRVASLAERSFDALFARCRADPGCRSILPDPKGTLEKVFDGLPVRLQVPHPASGVPTDFEMTESRLRGVLRLLAYDRQTRALVPALLHEAERGRWAPWVARALEVEAVAGQIAFGMHQAVTCSEDAPGFPSLESVRAELEATVIGSESFQFMVRSCRAWPRGPVDPDLRDPVRTQVPVLVLSGAHDPITPAEDGEALSQRLPHARHLVAPGQGHGVITLGCIPRRVGQFIRTGSEAGIDGTCVERLGPHPFALGPSGPGP